MSEAHYLGQRLSYDGALCTVRYIGDVAGTVGTWLGVEWDDPSRGKHDGSHKAVRYFTCLSRSSTAASFVRPSRPADKAQSFIAAIREKYVAEVQTAEETNSRNPELQIVYFGRKVAEEVGFDKIRRQLARLEELKIVIVDGLRIARDVHFADGGKTIKETSPLITELDLSRNLFESFGMVVRICRELEHLKSLRLNGNRFQIISRQELDTFPQGAGAFANVTELELEETLQSWDEIWSMASNFPVLTRLSGSLNQLSRLPNLDHTSLHSTLTSIELEFNDFTSLSDLSSLTSLTGLKSLHLKGNSISTVRPSLDAPPPIFSPSLVFLDVSYNAIASWSFVDVLPFAIPGLTALRLTHNPVYDNSQQAKTSDEAYMIATARLPNLKTLNYTPITPQERTNAELFYLSRIAQQLAAVPEHEEAQVLNQHPLYATLCDNYGEPDIVRREETNPSFLEARLVSVHFRHLKDQDALGDESEIKTTTAEIPRSFDVYSVKGIAGKMFGLPPLALKLIWETGEWDPVADYDVQVGDSSDEEDFEADVRMEQEAAAGHGEHVELRRGGKWVKREVELSDGPRQLGFCVDGLDVNIRVEVD